MTNSARTSKYKASLNICECAVVRHSVLVFQKLEAIACSKSERLPID